MDNKVLLALSYPSYPLLVQETEIYQWEEPDFFCLGIDFY